MEDWRRYVLQEETEAEKKQREEEEALLDGGGGESNPDDAPLSSQPGEPAAGGLEDLFSNPEEEADEAARDEEDQIAADFGAGAAAATDTSDYGNVMDYLGAWTGQADGDAPKPVPDGPGLPADDSGDAPVGPQIDSSGDQGPEEEYPQGPEQAPQGPPAPPEKKKMSFREKVRAAGKRTAQLMQKAKVPGGPQGQQMVPARFSTKEVQNMLIQAGYGGDLGAAGADGKYGRKTYAAIKRFQKDNGLVPDGIFGQKSLDAVAKVKPTAIRDQNPLQNWAPSVRLDKKSGMYVAKQRAPDGTEYSASDKSIEGARAAVRDLLSLHNAEGSGKAKAKEKSQNRRSKPKGSTLGVPDGTDPASLDIGDGLSESRKLNKKTLENMIKRELQKILLKK